MLPTGPVSHLSGLGERVLGRRTRVRRPMQLMDICSTGPGPDTSQRHPSHRIYPEPMRDLEITQPTLVWAAD